MGQTSPTADFQGGAPMQRIRTIEVPAQVGERVHVAGWLHSLRRLGGVSFLVIRDGWGTIQAVAEAEAELAPRAEVSAPVREAPPVTLGKREPKASLATLLDSAVITNRHPARRAILRLGAG